MTQYIRYISRVLCLAMLCASLHYEACAQSVGQGGQGSDNRFPKVEKDLDMDSCEVEIVQLTGDTMMYIARPFEVQLTASRDASLYFWSPGYLFADSTRREVNYITLPGQSDTLVLEALNLEPENRVFNGEFHLGDTGFRTDYSPFGGMGGGADNRGGMYKVVGKRLRVFPAQDTEPLLYGTRVDVDADEWYLLTVVMSPLTGSDTVAMEVAIDGEMQGGMDVLDWNQPLPVRLYREFYSPEAGTVDIELYDRSYGFGNHVGYFIDSVEVQRVCIARDTLIVTAACTTYYDTTVVYLCYDSTYVFNETTVISEPGEYDYTLTTPYGCDSNVHVNVLFEPCCVELIQCPNVVTPNGDGSNDKFVITNLLEQVCYPYNELYVYNRYGNEVYSRRNIASESDWWDPSNLPDGTYFYYFKARNGDGSRGVERKGAVEVMRK